jgi:drug/metabolite transporter (DMT)-like permease
MLAAALALCASLVWGVGDFVTGLLARRHAVATIAFLTHASGLVALAATAAVTGVDGRSVSLGAVAGGFGAITFFTFLKAMSLGTMSIVSPLLSCGSVLAFGLAVAAGERPSAIAVAGAVVALTGAVLASLEERASAGPRRTALGFAFASAVGLGGYLYLLGRGSSDGGTVSAVFGARLTSTAVLLGFALWLHTSFRIGRSSFFAVSLTGLGTVGAFVLYGYAADLGLISIASVLASLYPVVTVSLAHAFVGERLGTAQLAGVPLVLLGVVLVTAG